MPDTDMLSAKEAARELGTDARTFRKFMRATLPKDAQPGQGNRYQIDPDEVDELRAAFEKWGKAKAAPADDEEPAPKKTKKKKSKKPPVEEIDDEDDIDDPVDEELDDDDVELTLEMLSGPRDEELEDEDFDDFDIEDLD